MTLSQLGNLIPNHLIIQKRLWVGRDYVDIEYFDNDLNKSLDYETAFKKMLDRLGIKYN